MDKKNTRKIVREAYGRIAQEQAGCGCGACGPDTKEFAKSIGYSEKELAAGLRDVRISIKGSSACIDPDTKDPMGRAILESLGENESLEAYVVSVYAEGWK